MATLFVSDLHLDGRRPAVTALFEDFLRQRARQSEALYILGDLFEAWIGDDDDSEPGRTVAAALKALTDAGVAVYLIHGNRDFLLGARFAENSGVTLLPEAAVIDLYGTPTLIMHGDTLCTDDVAYQRFRARVRSAKWRRLALSLPLGLRRLLARRLRRASRKAVQKKAPAVMDVNQRAVVEALREFGVRRLIHGHTHRPAVHDWLLDGRPAQRIVLGDWYEQGSVLNCDAEGCRLERLTLHGV